MPHQQGQDMLFIDGRQRRRTNFHPHLQTISDASVRPLKLAVFQASPWNCQHPHQEKTQTHTGLQTHNKRVTKHVIRGGSAAWTCLGSSEGPGHPASKPCQARLTATPQREPACLRFLRLPSEKSLRQTPPRCALGLPQTPNSPQVDRLSPMLKVHPYARII